MKSWPTKSLEELAAHEKGAIKIGPFGSQIKKCDLVQSGIHLVGIENVMSGRFDGLGNRYITPEKFESLQSIEVKAGDLLITMMGTIGKVAIVPEGTSTSVMDSHLLRFRPNLALCLPEFVAWLIKGSSAMKAAIEGRAHGAIMKGLNSSLIRSLPAPVPPLAEQKRIVKLLDEADELRRLRVQADRRTAALLPALFYEMFGDPAMNSKGWPVRPLGDLASNQDGRRKPVRASDRAERKGEFPYYGASGIIDYVDEYLFDETALLIGEDGANLLARSTPIAFLAHGKYWVNNHAHVLTQNGNADLIYLCAALNLRNLTDYVTGSAQPKLNQANMNRITIPVPPLPLQKDFAKRVTEIREMEAAQTASRDRLDNLFQSSLHRAFRGEL